MAANAVCADGSEWTISIAANALLNQAARRVSNRILDRASRKAIERGGLDGKPPNVTIDDIESETTRIFRLLEE